jgi:hypothetical protein
MKAAIFTDVDSIQTFLQKTDIDIIDIETRVFHNSEIFIVFYNLTTVMYYTTTYPNGSSIMLSENNGYTTISK